MPTRELPATSRTAGAWVDSVARYGRLAEPSRWSLTRQLTSGLAVFASLFVALVALRINGSSMGLLYQQFFRGADPRLLLGRPAPIRSDEWLVSTPLTVSQVQTGLPRVSEVLPGGFDASIQWDLPTHDWSVLMRPHLWGFFALPLDYAYAFKWWLPFFILAAAAFVLICVFWRRPVAAWVVAAAFAVSPFFQWWFGAGTDWPAACALAACGATVVLLRSRKAWQRWVSAALAGYLVAVAVVALYPPYLVSCLYPAIACCIGMVATASFSGLPVRERLRRMVPLGVAALAAVAIVGLFFATHSATVQTIASTVYPGQRRVPTGQASGFPWTAMYAGVFASALHGDVTGFAPNASEGSSFLFLGFYLVASALWLVWARWRRLREIDWLIISVLLSIALLLAFTYVPAWDSIAHLLLLDRVNMPRIVVGFGVASLILFAVVVGRLRESGLGRIPWWTTGVAVVLVVGSHAAVWARVRHAAPAVLHTAILWPVMIVLLTIALAMFSRGRATVPAVLTGVVALVVAGWVNPIYQGVLDLRSTDIGRAIERIDAAAPGSWVATGGLGATAVLRETGVEAYSGVQGWPAAEMWSALDPNKSEREIWDRYAHVNWTANAEAPTISLLQPDVIQVRLDSCGSFAQQHLTYVLSDAPIRQTCLALKEQVTQGTLTYDVYAVTPSR